MLPPFAAVVVLVVVVAEVVELVPIPLDQAVAVAPTRLIPPATKSKS